ncbi:MAG: exodeoxyribonuclease VII large subunit [Pseudomonadota bacterium]
MADPKRAAPRPNLIEYTVTELSGAVKRALEDGFGYVRVRGELGRVTRAASGHMYLDLKDDRAVLSGVMWKGTAQRLSIEPEQGMEVIASGKVSTFPGQSRYQLIIDSLEPAGVGALMALLEERKKKLAAEGLFSDERKQALPFLPEVIGVVTSPSGAVIRDILHRLRDRFPRRVIVWPTLVQGRGAEEKIAAAIRGFNALGPGDSVPRPDVLIVARGGGSLEDLWCFNEEAVVRAAAASEIPLISAVGHETDTTLIDYASDRRAPTPTAAAEIAVPVRDELLADILNKERRLVAGEARLLEAARADLRAAARGLGRPEDVLAMPAQRVDRAGERLSAALAAARTGAATRFAGLAARLGPQTLAAGQRMARERLGGHGARLGQALRVRLKSAGEALAARRLSVDSVRVRRDGAGRDFARARGRFDSVVRADIARRRAGLDSVSKLLETLSHKSALARGFALVRGRDGRLVRSAASLAPGDALGLTFVDGEVVAAVLEGDAVTATAPSSRKPSDTSDNGETTPAKPRARAAAKKSSAASTPRQKSLFD